MLDSDLFNPHSGLNTLWVSGVQAGKYALIQPGVPETHILQPCTNKSFCENENFEYMSLTFHSNKSKKRFLILWNYFPILQAELQSNRLHPYKAKLISAGVIQGITISSHKSNSKIKASAGKTQAVMMEYNKWNIQWLFILCHTCNFWDLLTWHTIKKWCGCSVYFSSLWVVTFS